MNRDDERAIRTQGASEWPDDMRVPKPYCTAEGYRLGQWVRVRRTTKDRMSADRRQRLRDVDGWVWKAV